MARRHGLAVSGVVNAFIRVPPVPDFSRVTVGSGFDAADDWIAERAGPATIVVTGDILLADRCVKAGATVLGHDGRALDAGSIGSAVAGRALMADLRAMGAFFRLSTRRRCGCDALRDERLAIFSRFLSAASGLQAGLEGALLVARSIQDRSTAVNR